MCKAWFGFRNINPTFLLRPSQSIEEDNQSPQKTTGVSSQHIQWRYSTLGAYGGGEAGTVREEFKKKKKKRQANSWTVGRKLRQAKEEENSSQTKTARVEDTEIDDGLPGVQQK